MPKPWTICDRTHPFFSFCSCSCGQAGPTPSADATAGQHKLQQRQFLLPLATAHVTLQSSMADDPVTSDKLTSQSVVAETLCRLTCDVTSVKKSLDNVSAKQSVTSCLYTTDAASLLRPSSGSSLTYNILRQQPCLAHLTLNSCGSPTQYILQHPCLAHLTPKSTAVGALLSTSYTQLISCGNLTKHLL